MSCNHVGLRVILIGEKLMKSIRDGLMADTLCSVGKCILCNGTKPVFKKAGVEIVTA